MGFFDKFTARFNEKEIKKIMSKVEAVEKLDAEYSNYSDEQLKNKTVEFRERLKKGEDLDSLLPEAFATVREAAVRTLGMKHYRVQLIGGTIIHQGRIAEMRTGEGKTLMATLPVYLNALSEQGVHVITVNDYLAYRDKEWMGKLYEFLGLTVGCVIHSVRGKESSGHFG